VLLALFEHCDRVSLCRSMQLVSRSWREHCALALADRGAAVVGADVAANVHVAVLRHLAGVAGARVTLAGGDYGFAGERACRAHVESLFSRPTFWRPQFGPLLLAQPGVSLVAAAGETPWLLNVGDFNHVVEVRAAGCRLEGVTTAQPRTRSSEARKSAVHIDPSRPLL